MKHENGKFTQGEHSVVLIIQNNSALHLTLWEGINVLPAVWGDVREVCFNQNPQSTTQKINRSRQTRSGATPGLSAFIRSEHSVRWWEHNRPFRVKRSIVSILRSGQKEKGRKGVQRAVGKDRIQRTERLTGGGKHKSKGQSWNVYLGLFRLHE